MQPGGATQCCSQAQQELLLAELLLCAGMSRAQRFAPSGASGSRRTAAEWEHACSSLLGAGDRLAALALPGPSEGVVRCYIKRSSNLLGMSAHFELRLEASDELLAVAHKRVNGAASCYDIRLSSGAHGSGSSTPSSGPSYSGGSGTSRNSSSSGGGDSAQAHVVGKVRMTCAHSWH